MFKLKQIFQDPKKQTVFYAVLIIAAIITNVVWQIFCVPSTWATILLIVCFSNTIFFPILRQKGKLLLLTSFISAVSFCVCIYCVLFLEIINFVGLFLIPLIIGLIVYIPHFFVLQIFWQCVIKPPAKFVRISFLAGVLASLSVAFYFGHQYRQAFDEIKKIQTSNYKQLNTSFMTEKILGMHFIYHTRFCEYDGWRPPIHEPALVIGMWLNKRKEPLDVSLDQRIALYKKVFPNHKVKLNCSCAIIYSSSYHNDKRLN